MRSAGADHQRREIRAAGISRAERSDRARRASCRGRQAPSAARPSPSMPRARGENHRSEREGDRAAETPGVGAPPRRPGDRSPRRPRYPRLRLRAGDEERVIDERACPEGGAGVRHEARPGARRQGGVGDAARRPSPPAAASSSTLALSARPEIAERLRRHAAARSDRASWPSESPSCATTKGRSSPSDRCAPSPMAATRSPPNELLTGRQRRRCRSRARSPAGARSRRSTPVRFQAHCRRHGSAFRAPAPRWGPTRGASVRVSRAGGARCVRRARGSRAGAEPEHPGDQERETRDSSANHERAENVTAGESRTESHRCYATRCDTSPRPAFHGASPQG